MSNDKKVLIYKGVHNRYDKATVRLEASICGKTGNLVMEGYDSGLEEIIGDSSEHYEVVVLTAGKSKLMTILAAQYNISDNRMTGDDLLLELVKKYCNSCDGAADLYHLCQNNGIQVEWVREDGWY